MKKFFCVLISALVAFSSCATKDDIAALQEQIDGIKQTELAAMQDEFKKLRSAIDHLNEVDTQLNTLIGALTASKEEIMRIGEDIYSRIDVLELQDRLLDERIDSLNRALNWNIGKTRDWVDATFSTLDQYRETCTVLRTVRDSLGVLDSRIAGLEVEIASVNESLTAAIGSVSLAIDALDSRVKACEEAVASIQADLASRIQSLTFVPEYYDGKATWIYNRNDNNVYYPGKAVLYFEVRPAALTSAVAAKMSGISVRGVYTATRAQSGPKPFDIKVLEAKVQNNLLAVTLSPENVRENVFKGTDHLNLSLAFADGSCEVSTEYIPVQPMKYDYVLFEDDAFKKFMLEQVDGLFGNADGEVDMEEADALAGLVGGNTSFSSVAGIGMFLNLQQIDLHGNTHIEKLDVTANRALCSLNVNGCTSLSELAYDDAKIPSVEMICDFPLGHLLAFNGVKAVVCYAGAARKIIALESSSQYWDSNRSNPTYCGAVTDDGLTNTNLILAATSTCNAAKWCRHFGPTWYLPSSSELNEVGKHFDEVYANVTAKPSQRSWIWTSNEQLNDAKNAGNMYLNGLNAVCFNAKDYTFTTLAMKTF